MDRAKTFNDLIISGYECFRKLKFLQARERFELALKINPEGVYAVLGLAGVMSTMREYDKALEYLYNLKKKIKYPKVYHEIGKIKFWTGQFDEAVKYLHKAYELSIENELERDGLNNSADYYKIYAEVQRHVSNIKEMQLLNFDPLDPNAQEIPDDFKYIGYKKNEYARTLLSIGVNAFRNREYDLAERQYKSSIAICPCNSAYMNLSLIYFYFNEAEKIKDILHHIVKWTTKDLELANMSYALLKIKDFKQGWKFYEHRNFKETMHKALKEIELKKEWDFHPKKHKTVTFLSEQGYGDNIQFCRFLKDYKTNSDTIYNFVVYDQQQTLFEHNFPDLKIYTYPDLENHEVFAGENYLFVASFPYHLKITDKTIPYKEGYLEAPPANRERMKPFIKQSKKLKVGFCWQVNSGIPDSYNSRKIPIEYFLKLADIEGIELYSIQHGLEERPIRPYATKLGITMLGRKINDFGDTFAAVSYMDLVISPDTSLIHAAGSQGIPTWAILPKGADWRWFDYKEKNPWYDSGRLFYQKNLSDWSHPFNQVIEQLKRVASYHQSGELAKAKEAILFKNKKCLAMA